MKGGRDCPRRDRRLILGKRRVVKDAQSKSFDLAIRFLFFDKRSLFVRPFSRAQGFIPRIFHYSLSLSLSLSVYLGGKTAAWREGGREGVRKRKEDKSRDTKPTTRSHKEGENYVFQRGHTVAWIRRGSRCQRLPQLHAVIRMLLSPKIHCNVARIWPVEKLFHTFSNLAKIN